MKVKSRCTLQFSKIILARNSKRKIFHDETSRSNKQPKIESFSSQAKLNFIAKSRIDKMLVKLVVNRSLPLSLLDSKELKNYYRKYWNWINKILFSWNFLPFPFLISLSRHSFMNGMPISGNHSRIGMLKQSLKKNFHSECHSRMPLPFCEWECLGDYRTLHFTSYFYNFFIYWRL